MYFLQRGKIAQFLKEWIFLFFRDFHLIVNLMNHEEECHAFRQSQKMSRFLTKPQKQIHACTSSMTFL